MCQPVDKIDVVLREHDIVEILMGMGYIEAEAELFLLSSYHSPFESK